MTEKVRGGRKNHEDLSVQSLLNQHLKNKRHKFHNAPQHHLNILTMLDHKKHIGTGKKP
ncbi:MAG: hypothetical protein K8R06_06040 [Methanosarcinales archaeon]|nr:hypothetical protein [Methanosarcinales archaeon]MCD4815946.1 hypothetical protein [Methanosarcinales archaeon]